MSISVANYPDNKVMEVLLVEDDPGDVVLISEALDKAKIPLRMHHVDNGESALQYLQKQGEFKSVKTPDLILLDLNLPGKDGLTVLETIKKDENLQKILVQVLTTSLLMADIEKSYRLGANAYIAKPINLEDFAKIIDRIEGFWLDAVILPPK